MILRDDEGRALRAESLSDITKEIGEIEDIIATAAENKKRGGSMSEDEREVLSIRIEDLKSVITAIDDDMKKNAKTFELLAFIKQFTKFKKLIDDLQRLKDND